MPTVLVMHEVDDVEHWLASPKREEFFGPRGLTGRTFIDPQHPHRVGLIVEMPEDGVLEEILASPEAAEAMKFDGVRPDTVSVLIEK
jgi:hypothetical protein